MTLQVETTDERGKTWYRPIVARVKGTAPKSGDLILEGIEGYWKPRETLRDTLTVGHVYEFILTRKPNPGHNDYTDISKATPTDDQPIIAPSKESIPPSNDFEQPRNSYQRSKEEMRWTEAMHMATRMVGGADYAEETFDLIEQWAMYFNNHLDMPPSTLQQRQEPDSGASEPEEALFPDLGGVAPHPQGQGRFCPVHEMSELGPDGTHYVTVKGQRVQCPGK